MIADVERDWRIRTKSIYRCGVGDDSGFEGDWGDLGSG